MSNYTASKTDKVVSIFSGVSAPCDFSDTNSEETKSHTGEKKSPSKKIPSVIIPADWIEQPILTEEVLHDLEHMGKTPLREKYNAEAGSHRNMKSRLKKKKLKPAPEFEDFGSFLRIVGVNPYPHKGWSLHRPDNDNPNYGPGLCYWASPEEQNNCKGDNITLTIDGTTLSLKLWAEKSGNKEGTIRSRWRKREEKGYTDYEVIHGRKSLMTSSGDINCTPTSSKLSVKKSNSSSSNQNVSPDSSVYTADYKKILEEVHSTTIVKVTKKQRAMLNIIATQLLDEGVPAEIAIQMVFRYWSHFTKYACDLLGLFNPPGIPTPKFMTLAVNAIPGFYKKHHKEVEEIDRRKKEANRRMKLHVKKLKWVNKHIGKNPDYRDIIARQKLNEARKDLTEAEKNKVRSGLEYEMDYLMQSQQLGQKALMAFQRKEEDCN